MSVFRYINNSESPVVGTEHTVPAWDQLISNEELSDLNNIGLVIVINGIQQDQVLALEQVLPQATIELDKEVSDNLVPE